jgi:predicted phosphodiesterase
VLAVLAGLCCLGCSTAGEREGDAFDASRVDATDVELIDAVDAPAAADALVPDAAADQDTPRPTGPYEVPIGPEDRTFAAGPWLGATTCTGVAVSWQTEQPGDSVIEYGSDPGYGARAEGTSDATLHEVWLEGLDPERLYHYRACTGATCTGDLTFATAPLPGRPFRFAVYGDSQTNAQVHAQVSASVVASGPALVLHVGDLVGTGLDRASYVTEYFEPARRRNHYVTTWPVPGNHDWKDFAGRLQNLRDHFALPVDPAVPLAEASYAFSYGDAFFLALDNTMDGGYFYVPLGGSTNPPLWDWLVAQVSSEAAAAARWRFAFFHYPPSSACQESWPPMNVTRTIVLPLLQEHGFQAVFVGHTHDYEHQLHDRVHVFVTGGGGGDLDTDADCTNDLPELVHRQAVHHHLTLDLGAEQAVVRAVSIDGVEIDRVVLDREPGSGAD